MRKQKIKYKIITSLFLILALLISLRSLQAAVYSNNRIFVSAGEVGLKFKAPHNMCFLDPSSQLDEAIYNAFKYIAEKNGQDILLAVFTSCSNLVGAGESPEAKDIILNSGMLIWTPINIEEKMPDTRIKYIAMRKKNFKKYVKNKLAHKRGQNIDNLYRETDETISLGVSQMLNEGKKTTAVLAATTIRGIPIELILRETKKENISLNNNYWLADSFLHAQIFINE